MPSSGADVWYSRREPSSADSPPKRVSVGRQDDDTMLGALGDLGDFIGGIGVVVTLVYLAIQIRRNTEQTRLNTAGDAWSGILDAFDPVYGGNNTEIFQRGLRGGSDLAPADALTFSMLMTRILGQFELSVYQARHGALDRELLAMHSRLVQTIVMTPGGRQWWNDVGAVLFGEDFTAHVAEILVNPDERLPKMDDGRPLA
jgi:hypothetical protein